MTALCRSVLLLVLPQLGDCLLRLGSEGLVQYREGQVGIVIAVPHGGTRDMLDIPTRRYGTVEGDDHTKELGEVVANAICRNLGKCPHVVISNLKRTKLDPNRDINEAAQGNPKAEQAWRDYHGFIDEAKEKEGLGIVIDLHGQSHRRNSTELGYLLSTNQLNRGDFDSEQSSVRQLARRLGRSGKDIIAGFQSLGAYLEQEGYKAFPSPRQPSPGGQAYFPGYYTVERHGSRAGGRFDSVSVETPREVRIDAGRNTRLIFGEALGRAISQFYLANYQPNFNSIQF
eukprot:GFUD01005641.1.p1 GENE.GFUD01005641.1~~GFUD01005641.1.p1  ORF type:complete len:286 (-),score=52.26 GFUD01005641.1:390-1247(-)